MRITKKNSASNNNSEKIEIPSHFMEKIKREAIVNCISPQEQIDRILQTHFENKAYNDISTVRFRKK